MSIQNLVMDVAGQIGVNPRRVKMITTDSLATITTAGYLNSQNLEGRALYPTDILDVIYLYNAATNSGTYGEFLPSFSAGVITLTQYLSPGDVTLPVVDNDFANFDGTTGKIKDSGYSPTNAAKTKVIMLDAAPTSGRLASFTSTNGTIGDSGVAASAVQLSANIKATRTANIGGGGAGPISVAVSGLTAASIVTASIQASSNAVTIQKVTATSSGFDILFSGDPGATCTINYVAFVAAQ
jgi:hypothetical protein